MSVEWPTLNKYETNNKQQIIIIIIIIIIISYCIQ